MVQFERGVARVCAYEDATECYNALYEDWVEELQLSDCILLHGGSI